MEIRSFARTIRALCETSYFRQASSIAFIFSLMTLMTTVWGRSLIDNVMITHVREMVLADVRAQQVLDLSSVNSVSSTLKNLDFLEYRAERKVLLLDKNHEVEYGNPALLPVLGCLEADCSGWRHVQWVDDQGRHAELLGLVMPLADGGVYFSSYDMRPMMERVGILPLTVGASLFIVLLFSTAISVVFSADILKRVDAIRAVLRRYVMGDSAVRTHLSLRGDEIDILGNNINQALERINRIMDEVKSASSNIAHELGTPLTRLQNRLSTAAELASDSRVRAEIEQAAEEADRIQKLSRAILRIGEIESGRCQAHFSWLNAQSLLSEIADYYGPLAEERGNTLEVRCDAQCHVNGDRALLMQALSNLVDNALKYATENTPITIFARESGQWVELGVADHGPGIPLALRESAVLRFNRLQRKLAAPGYGLGLALVAAICKLHGGELRIEDNDAPTLLADATHKGLRAMLRLPQKPREGVAAA